MCAFGRRQAATRSPGRSRRGVCLADEPRIGLRDDPQAACGTARRRGYVHQQLGRCPGPSSSPRRASQQGSTGSMAGAPGSVGALRASRGVPRTATRPSSLQAERRRQQAHLLGERRSPGSVAGAPGTADALRASQQPTGGVVQAAVASVAQASQQRWSSRSSGCTRETSPFSRPPGWDLSGNPSAACVAAVHRMQESFSHTRMEVFRVWRSSTPTMPSFT